MPENLSDKLSSIEGGLKSFIGRNDKARAEMDMRMLAVEQRLTAPRTGSEYLPDSKSTGPAPKDQKTGLPILTKSHKLADNLPPGEVRGLDAGKYLRGRNHQRLGGSRRGTKNVQRIHRACGTSTLYLWKFQHSSSILPEMLPPVSGPARSPIP